MKAVEPGKIYEIAGIRKWKSIIPD
jgi:hypothetical protein